MLRRFGRQKYISLLVLLALLLPGCASREIPVETTAPPTTVPVTVLTTEPATVPTTVPTVCAECLAWEAGMTFGIDEQYILSGTADAFPLTFEAEFTLEKEQLTRENSLLNNDTAYDATLAYLIDENGHPKISFRTAPSRGYRHYVFSEVNVATGEKVHLAITLDQKAAKLRCYVNGERKQTISKVNVTEGYALKYGLVLGGDQYSGNATFFQGTMDSVALWAHTRTAEQIAGDASGGIDPGEEGLLAAYDLTRCPDCRGKDRSAAGGRLDRVALWQAVEDVEPVGEYDYAFAVIGDTQSLNKKNPTHMAALYDWLVRNQATEKIAYVIGLGDITNNSTDREWKQAGEYIGKLNWKIPYLLARGNHDDWDDMNRYFHNGYYEKTLYGMRLSGEVVLTAADQPGLQLSTGRTGEGDVPRGGTVWGDITNAYQYFSINGIDYLFLTLDFAPNDAMLQWACDVIEAHPDRRVIVATHAYMFRDGTTLGTDGYDIRTYYKAYPEANDGTQMWEEVFSRYENVQLVLSGHNPWQHIVYRQDEGIHGNTVTQMLINPQYVDQYLEPTAMVAMLYFSNEGNTLTVRYYSVSKGCYGSEASQFTIDLS